MKKIKIYTDGACSGNPGMGGWGALLIYNSHTKEISGSKNLTTNNEMELQAVVSALSLLKEPCEIDLTSDSQYVVKGASEWMYKWAKNSWRISKSHSVKNSGLWQEIYRFSKVHTIHWYWIKGHAGHPENEKCDQLATNEIQKLRESLA
ncbi:MAG: ribonuclease HI [Alphaproteobacteria bacterium]|nr:ribonuclease HI [Alphaproteobacteria bacterium]